MKEKSVWERLTPQQRKEHIAYRKEEYPFIPKWALRLHAPKKISEIPEELRSLGEEKLRLLFNAIPDEQHGEALRKYINQIPYIPLTDKETREEIISSYMASADTLMEGEYILSLMDRETAPKGHACSISPKEYWERVEAKRRADFAAYVGSRRERLLSAFYPIVEEALNIFFETFVVGSPEAEAYQKKIAEYGLRVVVEETLSLMEELALNWEIALNWEELDEAEEIRNNPDLYLVFGFFLTLIEELRECMRAAICRRGNDYLQRIDKERILSDMRDHFTDIKPHLKVDKNR